ncbi:hypothetical protein Patl1_36478 [Pistacia atlantica]|nr:hypothetical protein Patl1_36478 [Pistacia atlantica]
MKRLTLHCCTVIAWMCMSTCPCYLWFILKTLAFNYHGIKQHSLFPDIENLLMHTKTTAAEIVKQLRKDEDANNVLKGLFNFLKLVKPKGSQSNA